MKRKLIVTSVVCLCLVALLSVFFIGCNEVNGGKKSITIFVGEEKYTLVTEGEHLVDAIEELRAYHSLYIEGSDSGYGYFLTAIGSEVAEESNEYIAILTDDTAHQDITDYAVTKVVEGTSVTTASLGVSSLPIVDGATYAFFSLTF